MDGWNVRHTLCHAQHFTCLKNLSSNNRRGWSNLLWTRQAPPLVTPLLCWLFFSANVNFCSIYFPHPIVQEHELAPHGHHWWWGHRTFMWIMIAIYCGGQQILTWRGVCETTGYFSWKIAVFMSIVNLKLYGLLSHLPYTGIVKITDLRSIHGLLKLTALEWGCCTKESLK